MKFTTPALGIGLTIAAVPAIAQYNTPAPSQQQMPAPSQDAPESKGPKPSQGALKALNALQTAVDANDVANIPARVAAAQAVAKTKEDRYFIAVFQRQAALKAKDNVALAAAVEGIVSSGLVDSTKMAGLYMDLGIQQFNAKQLDLSAASMQRAVSITPNDPQALELLAQISAARGQKAEASSAFQRAIQARLASGQKPTEDIYRRAVQSAYDAQLPSAVDVSRQWITAYPSADSWRNSIAIYRNMTHPDVEGSLDLLRLLQAAGALSAAADYNLFATAAADQGNYNEAQAVLDAGIAAKIVDPASPLFKDTTVALKAKPKATAADLAEATKAATSGMALLRIGDRYYGMGNFPKAVELYRQSMSKPGVDPNIANLHIGMALTRTGDKPGATAAFKAVTGPRADIAKYWLLYVQSRA
jgi:tetratricopeptide (TPR) repeat protein